MKLTLGELYTVTFSGAVGEQMVKGMVNIIAKDLMDLAMFIKQGVQETIDQERLAFLTMVSKDVEEVEVEMNHPLKDFEILSIECRGSGFVTPEVIMSIKTGALKH